MSDRYRKKSVEVEALQRTESNLSECVEFCGGMLKALDSDLVLPVGYWVIRDKINSWFDTCSAEEFENTYDKFSQDRVFDNEGLEVVPGKKKSNNLTYSREDGCYYDQNGNKVDPTDKVETQLQQSLTILKHAMKDDPDYAHGWHCNIAMMCFDAGSPHAIANDAASRFMKLAFGVETSNDMLNDKNKDLSTEVEV